jgi:UPF0755 protein
MFKKIMWTTVFLLGASVCVLGVIWYIYFAAPQHLIINESRIETGAAVVTLDGSKDIATFAKELEDLHIIKSKKVFITLIDKLKIGGQMRGGIYVFTGPEHVLRILARLQSGQYGYTPIRITFPEGFTTYAMAEAISTKFPHISVEQFMNVAKEKEGTLFPDTYFFYTYVTPEAIVKTMEKNFERRIARFKSDFVQIESVQGKTKEDVLIMASILEKEVQTPEDKAMVSDLFWRRIENGMPLQADSTLTYVTGKDSFELTMSDLRNKDNPYNSYTHKGLPPTPISNPGIISIEAALKPQSNPYVFFLSDKDGKTHFSETYKEHLRLKEKYLR